MNLASSVPSATVDPPSPRSPGLHLVEARGPQRVELERFIAARFAEVYGAQVQHFMPRLLGLADEHGQRIAAFGLRCAAEEPLFLQRYLEAPAEQVVARRRGTVVARERLVEVGNLAGASPGALRQLIPALTTYLQAEGYHWLLFTGSARLCKAFTRLGLPLELVTAADAERLPPEERELWGSYYEQQPAVMLGDIRGGYRHLQALAQSPGALGTALAPVAGLGAP